VSELGIADRAPPFSNSGNNTIPVPGSKCSLLLKSFGDFRFRFIPREDMLVLFVENIEH
jgi:hypothetical protein